MNYLINSISILVIWINICKIVSSKHQIIDNNINGIIGAFGDFDSDRVTDIFFITDRGKSIELAKGCAECDVSFKQRPDFKCNLFNDSTDVIVEIIGSDFTGDSMMDLLVVTQQLDSVDSHLNIWLLRGNFTSLECNTTSQLATGIKSHPFVLDFNGDMISDFIVETNECSKQLWINLKPKCIDIFETNQTMSYPNSNAFINLNHPSDMSSDIFFSGSKFIEYWFNKRGFHLNNKRFIDYPDKRIYKFIGQSTFVDFNYDGKIDHIIPVCKSSISSCDEPEILALFQSHDHYEWIKVSDFKISSQNPSMFTFTEVKIHNYLNLFVTLRSGDIDFDGYPDLVAVMREKNSTKTHSVLLKNIYSNSNKFKREFAIQWTSAKILSHNDRSDNNVYSTAFFDCNEDGNLDILIGSSAPNGSLYLDALINNEKSSTSFLKVIVTGGLCYLDTKSHKCPNNKIAYGTNQFGPFLCFSPSDGRKTSCSGQLSQSAHMPLQMPYVVFGLGEIPNFIQNLTVSIPSGQMKSREKTWQELIPDSKIVIIPFPANKTDSWKQKLYLDPSFYAFSTLLTLTTMCCLLVIVIAIIHKVEMSEDIADHKEYKKHWL